MADIKTQVSAAAKAALRAGDKPKLAALRLIQAAFKQKEVDERIALDDDQAIAVLTRMAKQQRDALRQFEQAGRADLAEKERFELTIIEAYLPAQLSPAETDRIIAEALAETGAVSMREMGKVMALIKQRLGPAADMALISGKVKARLSAGE